MFVTTRPQWKPVSTVENPDGSVTTTHVEHELCYTNIFDEELRIPADPESEEAKADYAWHLYEQEHPPTGPGIGPGYKGYRNVRWESRTVTTTSTPWKTEENQ